jgi:hypothetical protein
MTGPWRIGRTFAGRVTIAAVLTAAALDVLVTDSPLLVDGGHLAALWGSAAVAFTASYLLVCLAELLWGAVHPPAPPTTPAARRRAAAYPGRPTPG